MNKKITGILLAVILAVALMSSCGGGKATTPTTSTTTRPTTSQTAVTTPPTSTSVTGAPSSTTPTTSVVPVTPTTPTTSAQPVTTTTPTTKPTTSTQPSTTAPSTTTRPPTTATSVTPTNTAPDLQAILGLAGSIGSVKYDMVISGPGTPTTTTRWWIEGKKMRMEMQDGAQTMVVIVDSAAKTYIMYTLPDKIGFSMAYQEQESVLDESQDILGYTPKIIGTETIDGKVCTIIEYTYSEKGATVTTKTWIWNQYGIPIKIEATDSTGKKTTMLYQNIVIGDIPDSMFQVPADVTIMSGLPTGLPF